jgi:hypothetical protein
MPAPRVQPEPTAEALLRALIEVFRKRGVDQLGAPEVVAALGERQGRPITASRLARTLKPYGVAPRQFRLAGRQTWGYLLADVLAGGVEGRDTAPPSESRDAWAEESPAPVAASRASGSPSDHLDAEQEWSVRLALAAAARWG